jgi:GH15 family glucan-1,4-alpha-glucosidase
MNGYPNISDHGLIGDLQTAALVSTDGTVDWFCCPRFDSPSVFASLLDAERGGYFRITPDTSDYVSKQLYFLDTAMLITRFMTPDGVGEVTDFMPIAGTMPTDRHRLVRLLRVVRGVMTSTTSRAGAAPGRCASATAPPTSCSWTSTGRRWTPSTWGTPAG